MLGNFGTVMTTVPVRPLGQVSNAEIEFKRARFRQAYARLKPETALSREQLEAMYIAFLSGRDPVRSVRSLSALFERSQLEIQTLKEITEKKSIVPRKDPRNLIQIIAQKRTQ
jgi:hypothetical protein